MISNKRQFLYNLISSYGSTLVSSILGFISVPIALNYWGKELYGIWAILISFATYISISGLGIDTATGILMTKNTNFKVKIEILKKGVKLLLICAIIGLGLLTLLTFFFPEWLRIIGKMSEENYYIAKISALVFIAGILINLPLGIANNALPSFGKAYINSLVSTFQSVVGFVFIIITTVMHFTLPIYILLTVVNNIVGNIIKIFFLLKYKHNVSYDDLIESEDNSYKTIVKTGINLSIYGLAILIIPNISNLIISNSIDVSSLVPYSMSYKLFSTIVVFVTSSNIAMAPIMGKEFGNKNWDWLISNYRKMFYLTVPFTVFLVLGVIWFSKPFIYIWTGSLDNYAGDLISVLLGIYFFIFSLNNLNLTIINTFNYTDKVWLISWSEGLIFVISSILIVRKMDVVGIPLCLCFASMLVSFWAYPFVVYKRSERKIFYDYKFLIIILIVFTSSIICYLLVNKIKLPLLYVFFIDLVGYIISMAILYIILPKDIRNIVISKLKRKN